MEYAFRKQKLVGFIDHGDEFWESLEEGVFRLPKCRGCKRWMWESNYGGGPTVRCGECGCWELDWVEVEPKGIVYAWAKSNRAYPGAEARAEDVPYTSLEVEVGGVGGPRVIGVFEGGQEADLRVDAEVFGKINPPSEKSRGYASIGWVLASCEDASNKNGC